MRDAQSFIHNFVDVDVKVDGIRGTQTNKGVIKVIRRCIDLDYGVHLACDGIAGAKTLAALNYVTHLASKIRESSDPGLRMPRRFFGAMQA